MSHFRLLMAYGPFLLFWLLDLQIKNWFVESNFLAQFGPIHFAYTENHGIIMGSLSKLPLMVKTVFLSTLGVALVASFPVIMSLIHFKSKKTVVGLSLVLSGILGNVTDRVIYGFVVDFVYFKIASWSTPVFNLADTVQWVGYVLLIFGIYKELVLYYPENDRRNGGMINPSYQMRFAGFLLGVFTALQFTFFIFGYTFVKFMLVELALGEDDIARYLNYYVYTSLAVYVFSSLVILLIGKIISQRIAGPVYAIQRYVQDTLLGRRYPLKLRTRDHLKELEAPLSELNSKFAVSEFDEVPAIPEDAKKAG